MKKLILILCAALLFLAPGTASAARFNAFNQKNYTAESQHFRIHYARGLKPTADEVAIILERLYGVYKDKYGITLPTKTEVIISNDDYSGGWALAIQNTIHIWASGFDWNLRGDRNWLENVVAHEYAHIVSISASFKGPSWIPYLQGGYFTHPNAKNRMEAFQFYPNEILPVWFFEGIAQYESTRQGGDSWDSHRDMILRTLSVSDNLATYDRINSFSFLWFYPEMSYDHGFSLVKYIASKYGEDRIPMILRAAAVPARTNFDRAVKTVVGISARQLYADWKNDVTQKYKSDITNIGVPVYGRDISPDATSTETLGPAKGAYYCVWPRFAHDGKSLFYIANGMSKGAKVPAKFYRYSLDDTTANDKRAVDTKLPVTDFYSVRFDDKQISHSRINSRKSIIPTSQGGWMASDLYTDTIKPSTAKNKLFAGKTEKQITKRAHITKAVYSPDGRRQAVVIHDVNRYRLDIVDTAGKLIRHLIPMPGDTSAAISFIYNLDWSPKGDQIAISYLDRDDRDVGIIDTAGKTFSVVCDTKNDERDPRFSSDGNSLLFSSDRTGIFNIYRYSFNASTIEQLTNVTGGAFYPDISPDGLKLAYSGFAPAGYRIYLIDTIRVISSQPISADQALVSRVVATPAKNTTMTNPRPYNKFPRKGLLIPTIFGEQSLTKKGDYTQGQTTLKTGIVLALMDPLFWKDQGNYIGSYLLLDIPALVNSFKHDKAIPLPETKKISYDIGAFCQTSALPLDISISYAQRGIAGTDEFRNDSYGDTSRQETLEYNLSPRAISASAFHWISNPPADPFDTRGTAIHLFGGYETYKVWVKPYGFPKYIGYVPIRGPHIGAAFTHMTLRPGTDIAPRGTVTNLAWSYNSQQMQNEVNSFTIDGGQLKENYLAPYKYNALGLQFRNGRPLPWSSRHNLQVNVEGFATAITEKSKTRLQEDVDNAYIPNADVPTYMKNTTWLPGYVYYFKDTLTTLLKKKDGTVYPEKSYYGDTLLIAGNALLRGDISYRVPLAYDIDRKFGFIYFQQIYASVNAGGAIAANTISSLPKQSFSDGLYYVGGEIRVAANVFSTTPLAISLRYDNGLSRAAPLGGSRWSLKFGTSFENWDIIVRPDGARPKNLLPRARIM